MYAILYTTKTNNGNIIPRVFSVVDDPEDVDTILAFLRKNPGRHFNGSVDADASNYVYCIIPEIGRDPKFNRREQTKYMIQRINAFNEGQQS